MKRQQGQAAGGQPPKVKRVADAAKGSKEDTDQNKRPSCLKQEESFPFLYKKDLPDKLRINKFSISLPEDVLVAFTVHGPILALERAFETLQTDDSLESKYIGIFQQILPTFSLVGGNLLRKFQQVVAVPDEADEADAADYDTDDTDDTVSHRKSQEKIEQGEPDFLVRVITKETLDGIIALNPDYDWDQLDERQLSETAFRLAEDSQMRIDCIIDMKTDSVSAWNVKTRAQLISYGHQAALQNLQKGFAPRPIYLVAIHRDAFRYCIFDPCGIVTLRAAPKTNIVVKQKAGEADGSIVGDYELAGLVQFRKQTTMRSAWLQEKPDGKLWDIELQTRQAYLEQRLGHVNTLLESKGKQRIAYGSYVVAYVREEPPRTAFHAWNGRGLTDALLPGSLKLCQGLLRILAGDDALSGWTREGLISAFRQRREREHAKCIDFEQSYRASSGVLYSQYQEEIRSLTRKELDLVLQSSGSSAYRKGFVDAIAQVKNHLRELVAKADSWELFLKVVRVYGGEFEQLLWRPLSSLHEFSPRDISLSIHHAEALVDKVLICKEVTVPVVSASKEVRLVSPSLLVYNGPESFDARCLLGSLYELESTLVIVGTQMDLRKIAALQKRDVRFFLCEDWQVLEKVAHCTATEIVSDMGNLPEQLGSALEMVVLEGGMTLYCARDKAKDEGKLAVHLQIGGPNFLAKRARAEAAINAIGSALAKGILPSTAYRLVSDKLECKEENMENPEVEKGVLAVKGMLAKWGEVERFHLWEPVDDMLTTIPDVM